MTMAPKELWDRYTTILDDTELLDYMPALEAERNWHSTALSRLVSEREAAAVEEWKASWNKDHVTGRWTEQPMGVMVRLPDRVEHGYELYVDGKPYASAWTPSTFRLPDGFPMRDSLAEWRKLAEEAMEIVAVITHHDSSARERGWLARYDALAGRTDR